MMMVVMMMIVMRRRRRRRKKIVMIDDDDDDDKDDDADRRSVRGADPEYGRDDQRAALPKCGPGPWGTDGFGHCSQVNINMIGPVVKSSQVENGGS
jgi:hypothetical protein